MRISIEITEAAKKEFSAIKLGFTNYLGVESKVALKIKEFTNAYDYTSKDLTSVKFDFFLMSAIVYGIDNLLDRGKYSVDGWAREIEVQIPVYNLDRFIGNEKRLEEILNFLTGDYWSIQFSLNNVRKIFKRKIKNRTNFLRYKKDNVKKVSLFSGGLDSLIGVIDTLETLQSDEKMLFVSHFDSNSTGTNKAQKVVSEKLNAHYPQKIYWIQTKVALARLDDNMSVVSIDSNYRSRSLLFIALGTYLSNVAHLIIPENGTISINYPLTPSRVSSLSTRTTHPFVIAKLQGFLFSIGLEITIENPYSLQTKGEMVLNCLNNTNTLRNVFSESISCGKKPRNRNKCNNNRLANHCGICMPCIYRRASLNMADLDNDNDYFNDLLKITPLDNFVDIKALFSYLKRNITKDQMKTDLVVYGSIKPEELDDYADLVLKSKEEVLKLFRDKGNRFVKNELGLL